jgi:hypothetical protein
MLPNLMTKAFPTPDFRRMIGFKTGSQQNAAYTRRGGVLE